MARYATWRATSRMPDGLVRCVVRISVRRIAAEHAGGDAGSHDVCRRVPRAAGTRHAYRARYS